MTALPAYGGGRKLPVHATLDEPRADFDSGLLLRIQASLLLLADGQILRLSTPIGSVLDDLRTFEQATGHALLAVVPDDDRPGWRDYYVRKGQARTTWDGPDAELVADRSSAVLAQSDVDALMPRRLWLYTNYDCNLACDYCCVVAGPRADPRRLSAERIRDLVGQAADVRLERVFLTGGEPFLRPDLAELIAFITDRLPLTLLTNAMLLNGRRWDQLAPLLAQRRPITFQVSLDSAAPELHDGHRGVGSHARALAGIRALLGAGAHVRLAATLPAAQLAQIPALHDLADSLGVMPADRIFRPIALRGAATEGEPIRPEDVAPEFTCDAQGWFWHPVSNDADMRLTIPEDASLAEASAEIRRRLETLLTDRAARLDRFVCG